MNHLACLAATLLASLSSFALTYGEFESPVQTHKPEAWFYIIGGNASREGITADLQSLVDGGVSGIQFFHGEFGGPWPNVKEQIRCLSPKWDDLIRFISSECRRLGLTFKLQNCPGWSMSGGPWIGLDTCMRQLVMARKDLAGGEAAGRLPEPTIGAHTPTGFEPDHGVYDGKADYRDVAVLAFPAPSGDESGEELKPVSRKVEGNVHEFRFGKPVTVRTVEIPAASQINHAMSYELDLRVKVEADGRTIADELTPQGNWQDTTPQTIACDETTGTTFRVTFTSPHALNIRFVRFRSAARLDNWEALAGWTLRDVEHRERPKQSAAAWLDPAKIVDLTDRLKADGTLDWTAPAGGRWIVLRFGHANQGRRNHPAPAAATGWECDKLDPRGADAAFAGYVGRIAQEVLPPGSVQGVLIDSWECMRQTWTWKMPEYYRAATGGDVRRILPQIFGWIVGDPAATERDLLAWRGLLGRLAEDNYFKRMADNAHAHGMTMQYETAYGDVLPGDLMRFWRFADEPMCEFWTPHRNKGFVGSHNFKPVRPCVSAAHVYGQPRVAAESFTSFELTWDEDHRLLKNVANKHLSRGVTHCVYQIFTHNPVIGQRPGSSFGAAIGTPFLREQTWWPWMKDFSRYLSRCETVLEAGVAEVDVLRLLGDELGHKPDENFELASGFKHDLLNTDALMTTLSVKDGKFLLPRGATYSVIWVPAGTYLAPATEQRLAELERQGGRIVRGDDPTVGLVPDVKGAEGLMWYHRRDGALDAYFVAADAKGWKGTLDFPRAAGRQAEWWDPVTGRRRALDATGRVHLALAADESGFIVFGGEGAAAVPSCPREVGRLDVDWKLAIDGHDLDLPVLKAWKDLPLDPATRAFSGSAVYRRTFDFPATEKGRVELDLGRVERWARVKVNGREVASLWCEPYRADITSALRPGKNELEIEVASTWFNRLVYDAGRPEKERTTWTIAGPKAGSPLREYGLFGPVRVMGERQPSRVLFIGLDGLSSYALRNGAEMPTFRRLMKEGASSLAGRTVIPSASAPNWASMFMCAPPSRHGVIENALVPKIPPVALDANGRFPDFFRAFRVADPSAKIGFVYEWSMLPAYLDTNACDFVTRAISFNGDIRDFIAKARPDLMAIIINHPDDVGHSIGWNTPAYFAELPRLDGILKDILDCYGRNGLLEDTLVIVTSDHGGIGKKHGGTSIEEMERPIVLWGKGIRPGVEIRPGSMPEDVGRTIAAALGVEPSALWGGRVLEEAFLK